MKTDKTTITRLCFKRDKQLLSDTAAKHKRNLLLFSSTAIALILLSLISGNEAVKSIFGITFNDEIEVSTIVFILIFPISYESIQFYFHCKKSITSFTEFITTEKPEQRLDVIQYSLADFENKYNSLIKEHISDFSTRSFEKYSMAINNDVNTNFNDFHDAIGLIYNFNHMVKALLSEYTAITNNLNDNSYHGDALVTAGQISTLLRSSTGLENYIQKIYSLSEPYKNMVRLDLQQIAINSQFDLNIVTREIDIINNNYIILKSNLDSLIDSVNAKSMGPKDLYLTEIYLPSFVAGCSIIMSIAYVISLC